jgi:hypothetical protein
MLINKNMDFYIKKDKVAYCYNSGGSFIEAVSIPLPVIIRKLKQYQKRLEKNAAQNIKTAKMIGSNLST